MVGTDTAKFLVGRKQICSCSNRACLHLSLDSPSNSERERERERERKRGRLTMRWKSRRKVKAMQVCVSLPVC